jgi:FkbM family methyltransferase
MYGSDYIAAKYCGFERPPKAARGVWQHGWIPQRDGLLIADQVFGVSLEDSQTEQHWVATRFLENFIRAQGFRNVRAIGMPLVYVTETPVLRRPGSLLVMPIHSLHEQKLEWANQDYVQAIIGLRAQFQEIVICVNAACWENGYWVPEFQAAGFTVIRGADGAYGGDPLTLQKMVNRFKEFEFVTTNGFGSHLAYASSCGAKVSIYGPIFSYDVKTLAQVNFYRDHPELVEPTAKFHTEQSLRVHFPEFFCHPAEAVERTDWGRKEIGWDNKISPAEMRELFGWTLMGRVGARVSNHVRQTNALVPRPIKRRVKEAWAALRRKREEFERWEKLPRFTPGATELFGRRIEFLDAWSYSEMHEELFNRQFYRFTARTEQPLIIDVGANIGMSVLYFKCLYPKSRVIAFEADPAIYQVLQRNVAAYELEGVELVPQAVWKCETELEFQSGNWLSGRVLNHRPGIKTVKVPACRLQGYLEQSVDLLKLDIEGAETDVLLDCADSLKNVQNIVLEHHSFLNKPQNLHVVVNLLHNAGFRLFMEPSARPRQPLMARTFNHGMDVQINIFGFRP